MYLGFEKIDLYDQITFSRFNEPLPEALFEGGGGCA